MTIYQKYGVGSSEMVNYQRGGELRWKYHLLVGVEAGGGERLLKKGRPGKFSVTRQKVPELEDDHFNERL